MLRAGVASKRPVGWPPSPGDRKGEARRVPGARLCGHLGQSEAWRLLEGSEQKRP